MGCSSRRSTSPSNCWEPESQTGRAFTSSCDPISCMCICTDQQARVRRPSAGFVSICSADQEATSVQQLVSFKSAKLSRADVHIDWQGGYAPSLASVADELHRFIRPGKTKWGLYGAGQSPTGYTFGKGNVQARIYNKSREATEKANDAYFALLIARNAEAWDPSRDVWRLEFELKREGAKGFKLYAPPEVDDDDAILDAELSAEELEHIGTLPRFFARMHELFAHLTHHWLRLVVDNGSSNRSRWPLDPTWQTLRDVFTERVRDQCAPLDEDGLALVRGSRYSGRSRVLRRLLGRMAKVFRPNSGS
jgi:hypothetical protein